MTEKEDIRTEEELLSEIESDLKRQTKEIKKGRSPSQPKNPGMMSSIATREWNRTKTNISLFFLLGIFLYVLDFFTGFGGADTRWLLRFIRISDPQQIFQIFVNVLTISAILIYWFFKRDKLDYQEIGTFSFVIFTLAFIISQAGLSQGVLFHLIITILIWVGFIRTEASTKSQGNVIFGTLLLLDFFGFELIELALQSAGAVTSNISIIANRLIFPIWIVYFLFTPTREEKPRWMHAITIIYILTLSGFFLTYTFTTGSAEKSLSQAEKEEAKNFLEQTIDKWKNTVLEIKKGWNDTMSRATGKDYYLGKVDEKAQEKLGVFIDNMETSDKRYYENEAVDVWATLTANTLDIPVNIKLSCYAKQGENQIFGETSPDYFENDDEKNIVIESYDQEEIDCRFTRGELSKQYKQVTFNALFNFKTSAYLKTYYMNAEAMKGFREEGDVLSRYQITDKSPIAIHTKGPVKVGMKTKEQLPIGLNTEYDTTHHLGITIDINGWQGKIKEITDLVLYLPEYTEIEPDSCNYPFEEYELTGEDEQEGYHAYKLSEEAKKYSYLNNIRTPFSFNCRITVKKNNINQLLDNTNLKTRYFKADIEYVFELEKNMPVNIETPNGFYVKMSPVKPLTKDDIECTGKLGTGYYSKELLTAEYEFFINDASVTKGTVGCTSNECPVTLSAAKTKAGDSVKCVMTTTLEDNTKEQNYLMVTVRNTPPKITSLYFDRKATSGEDLTCIANITDADDDIVKVSFLFEGADIRSQLVTCTKVGEVCQAQVTIQGSSLSANTEVTCIAIPIDSESGGEKKEVKTTVKEAISTTCSSEEEAGKKCGDYMQCNALKECVPSCTYQQGIDWVCQQSLTEEECIEMEENCVRGLCEKGYCTKTVYVI